MQTRVIGERVYDYSHNVGGTISIMAFPVSLAFGSEDVVYVLSRQYEMVHDVPWNKTGRYAKVAKLSIGMVPGDEEHLGDLGRYGDEDGQLIWPAGIAVDSDENVYVTDEWLNRISVWDSDGNFLTLWGTAGQGDGEFDRPSGVAIDREDNVYVVDSVSHRIQKLTKDGTFLAKWGSFGGEEGQFNAPWGITVDHEGYVYVADHKNH